MRFQKIVLATLALSLTTNAFAKTERDLFGAQFTIHGDPAPSIFGLNLALDPLPFIRLKAGVGGYHADLVNGPKDVANTIIMPIAYGFYYIGYWAVRGKKPKSFNDFKFDKVPENESVLTYGAAALVRAPVSDHFLPTLGIHRSRSRVHGETWNLPPRFEHTYYSVGMDLQWAAGSGTRVVSAGMNICPDGRDSACGFYVGFGSMF